MSTFAARLVATLALLALGGCWSQGLAVETDPTPPVKRTPLAESRPNPNLATPPPEAGTSEAARFRPASHVVRVVPGGVTIVVRSTPPEGSGSRSAVLRCTLPIGRSHGKPGQADLATALLVAGAEKGQPSLERAVAELGGTVLAEVGTTDTAIDLIVPTDRWPQALERLSLALLAVPSAEAQLETVRLRLLREWRARFGATPLPALLPRVIQAATPSAGEWLARTQELTLDEVRTFWRMLCRPVGAVIVLDPGQGQTEAVFGAATSALGPWTAALGGAEPAARQAPLQALRGLVWAERAGLPRAGVLFARAELGADHALEVLVLQACLTQGGIGGRLARELERTSGTAPILVEETVRDGAQRYAFLSTTATVEQAVLLANALGRAVDSLTQRPPEEDELRTALARARLQVMADESDRRAWLSTAVTLGRTNATKPLDLGEEVKRLVDPKLLDLRGAAAAFRASVLATVVLGGSVPPDVDAKRLADPIPPDRIAETLSPDDTGREQAAKPYLDAALRALGGRENLTGVRGFSAAAIVKGDNGAAFEESVFWREDARLRRVRRVLGTKIEAVVAGTSGSESSGEQTLELGSDEVRSLLQRAERHPVALISGWVYGRFRFKLVSLRSVEDREMAILELIDPSRERMRVQIDTGSGLVRQVETREHWPSVGKVQIVETYSDYRTQRGVRSPFHVVTNVDSGGMTVVTDYGTFVPRTPPDQDLVRGGPERPESER